MAEQHGKIRRRMQIRFDAQGVSALLICPASKRRGTQEAPCKKQLKPKIGFADNLILKQLLAGAFGDDLTRREDVIAGGHFKDRADFLFN